LDAFAAAPSVGAAVIAVPAGSEERVGDLIPDGLPASVVAGGATRAESVGAALARVGTDLVAVHDAARPLVTAELIETLVARLVAEPEAAGVISAAPLTDTVKRVEDERVVTTERREELWGAQTPQVFRTEALRKAHEAGRERLATATDDATLVERVGGTVLVERAAPRNLKVTTPDDLRLAALLLSERR
jgi:2-C-methyl-D-erythritol 4-phosphate cytidylyltransferase